MIEALGASVSHGIIRSTGRADEVLGAMCLVTNKGLEDVTVDAAAARGRLLLALGRRTTGWSAP